MKDNMYSPTTTAAWSALKTLATSIDCIVIQDFFDSDADRANNMTVQVNELLLDYSKNLVSHEILQSY